MLGHVKAYIGLVETQGRGTLHLHMLIWLAGAPAAERLGDLFKTAVFRSQVEEYIRQNFRASIPGVLSRQDLQDIPLVVDVAYSRPPKPDSVGYDVQVKALEKTVARTKQLHTCTPAACLRLDRTGKFCCKHRAPWPLSSDDIVHEDGTWLLRREIGYLNPWIPALTINLCCNNDGKLLTNGDETRGLTYYVSMYVTKKQGRSFNASALWTNALAYHFKQDDYHSDLQERQRKLLFRAVNVLNREQEVAGPLVMAYLIGSGDIYRSHHYVTVYMSAIYRKIYLTWPALRQLVYIHQLFFKWHTHLNIYFTQSNSIRGGTSMRPSQESNDDVHYDALKCTKININVHVAGYRGSFTYRCIFRWCSC